MKIIIRLCSFLLRKTDEEKGEINNISVDKLFNDESQPGKHKLAFFLFDRKEKAMKVKTFETQRVSCIRENVYTYEVDENISCSDELYNVARKLGLHEAAEEYFCIACFNTKGKIIAVHEVSHGDINSSLVHPREIFKRAITKNASEIALMHNHPSGDSTPSKDDKESTKRISECGDILGIRVIDHLIVTDSGYISMKATNDF